MTERFVSEFSDDELGMDREITRRDFVDGVAKGVGAAAFAGSLVGPLLRPGAAKAHGWSPSGGRGGQPPTLTGMRGTNDSVKYYMDKLMAGRLNVSSCRPTGEDYDLVVVGAGISGLSAAYFYLRDVDSNARILILDPHDDFGGHARRNEILIDDVNDRRVKHRRIANGGSATADHVVASQGSWTDYGFGEAKRMLDEIGMGYVGQNGSTPSYPWPSGGQSRTLWMKEHWNARRDVFQLGLSANDQVLQSPMAELAKRQRIALNTAGNWLAHLSPAERVALIKKHTCGTLVNDVGPQYVAGLEGKPLHPDVLRHLYANGSGGLGFGWAMIPALDAVMGQAQVGVGPAMSQGFETIPGESFPAQPISGAGMTGVLRWNSVGGTVVWPGGNSSVARHLVAKLVPGALDAATDAEFLTAWTDYSKLDQRRNNVRIRLNSTVVRAEHARHRGKEQHVDVVYVDHESGRLRGVRAKHLFFGCWNHMIPFIAPDLPQIKKQALADAVKLPLEYTRVGLTNYQAFMEAGVTSTSTPGAYYTSMGISRGAVFGDPANPVYQDSAGPDKPVIMSLTKASHTHGLRPDGTIARWSAQESARRGQQALVNQSFREMERRIRDNLARCMQGTSFDPGRDIGAVVVNRWQQGYMRWYHLPNDASFWRDFGTDLLPKGPTPNRSERRPGAG